MIVLEKYKILQKLVGLNPLGGIENVIVRLTHWLTFLVFYLMQSIFIFYNIQEDVLQAQTAMIGLSGSMSAISMTVHLFRARVQYYALLDELQNIVNERMKCAEIASIYMQSEERMTLVVRMGMLTQVGATLMSTVPFVLVIYHSFLGKYTLDSWIFFYPVWTPYELDSTIKCVIVAVFETMVVTLIMYSCCVLVVLLIGFAVYAEACFLDIKTLFDQIDRMLGQVNSDEIILRRCREAVILHIRLNRCLGELADIMNTIVLFTIAPATLCKCCALVAVDRYSGDDIFYDLQMPILAVMTASGLLFILFSLGQWLSTSPASLSDMIYQSQWYRYSLKPRIFVQFLIMRSQRKYSLSAFGAMALNLSNYVSLLKTVYSAYMVLRRFS